MSVMYERLWSKGGMVLTAEKRVTRTENGPSAILTTIDLKFTSVDSNQALRV